MLLVIWSLLIVSKQRYSCRLHVLMTSDIQHAETVFVAGTQEPNFANNDQH